MADVQEEKFGIKETKEMVDFLVSVIQGAIDSAVDGRLDLWDIRNFFKSLRKVGAAFKDCSKIGQELSDLSDKEIAELEALVNSELSIGNLLIDGFVKQAIIVLLEMLKFVPFVEALKGDKK